ncbi:hypothetical protein PTSG_04074 [Salpingoeca rosetta]|uniref:Uncharacterized protein n=1 Tax=Salpingoeca rosetta (strain ATCC 50818 / BSB-021) TaxID=946362 RepID=F2U6I4_SALR5|nr:uncharacterized protein PTSG_04074 [Salpingoeca rosetta]EGD83466.1 hypothetical protein PTSG_04074 [Salpingoeca rosetta]|eukprot:XP_004994970.1 hypothetical protein PTSG_04074 [Salpingoeca rosetta]
MMSWRMRRRRAVATPAGTCWMVVVCVVVLSIAAGGGGAAAARVARNEFARTLYDSELAEMRMTSLEAAAAAGTAFGACEGEPMMECTSDALFAVTHNGGSKYFNRHDGGDDGNDGCVYETHRSTTDDGENGTSHARCDWEHPPGKHAETKKEDVQQQPPPPQPQISTQTQQQEQRQQPQTQQQLAFVASVCWPEVPVNDSSSGIPRRIIQTWKTHRPRGRFNKFLHKMQRLNPDFEYMLFDDQEVNDFVATHFPRLKFMWDHLIGPFRVQRYDLFRMLAVYHYGGFYLDMDVELEQGLAPLLDQEAVFPHEEMIPTDICRKHGQYGRWPWPYIDCSREFPQLGQFAFGARRHHPFLRRVIEAIYAQFISPDVPPRFSDVYIFTTSGPDLVSHVYNQSSPAEQQHVTVLYPHPYDKFRFGDYGVHHMAGAWRKWTH